MDEGPRVEMAFQDESVQRGDNMGLKTLLLACS